MLLQFFLLCFLSLLRISQQASLFGERDMQTLSKDDMASLIRNPDPVKNLDPADPTSHLSHILIPRAPGTENNTLVRKYIVSRLEALHWHVEEDEFTDMTPIGSRKFTNVIATKDPEASRRVIVAAHFDSKWFRNYPENQFVGATDSAAPCAMMLDLAEALDPLLDERAARFLAGDEDDDDIADTTLQLIFFDGEEAFISWTATDSIYGARHLAQKWATTFVMPSSLRKRRLLAPQTTLISTIEHFILLDLLGAQNPRVRNYYTDTAWLFDWIKGVETRLANDDLLFSRHENNTFDGRARFHSFFTPRTGPAHNTYSVEDDHIPFLREGVSVLHLITEPFPRVWHELADDASALDVPTMRRWNIILRVFMSEYLNLRPLDSGKRSSEPVNAEDDEEEVTRTAKIQRSDSELE